MSAEIYIFCGLVVSVFILKIVSKISIKSFLTHLYTRICQAGVLAIMGRGEVIVSNNVMQIPYHYNGTKYVFLTPVKLGLKHIRHIFTQSMYDGEKSDDDDKTMAYLISCLGPYKNFHNIPTTPKMLGINQPIVIEYINNSHVTYKDNDVMSITSPK